MIRKRIALIRGMAVPRGQATRTAQFSGAVLQKSKLGDCKLVVNENGKYCDDLFSSSCKKHYFDVLTVLRQELSIETNYVECVADSFLAKLSLEIVVTSGTVNHSKAVVLRRELALLSVPEVGNCNKAFCGSEVQSFLEVQSFMEGLDSRFGSRPWALPECGSLALIHGNKSHIPLEERQAETSLQQTSLPSHFDASFEASGEVACQWENIDQCSTGASFSDLRRRRDQKHPDFSPNSASVHSGALLITPGGFLEPTSPKPGKHQIQEAGNSTAVICTYNAKYQDPQDSTKIPRTVTE
ncbi:hypothetical protein Anapl_11864 [Anas platyrhynchos]|uniref:Uncharacterized protein n=1 Tax=Anas platyrhynchos TaxID=8839 RepID=R0KDY9_ANAPL|nr:hypothetical protein Anapl_11864 [Anas platyrhynchos]